MLGTAMQDVVCNRGSGGYDWVIYYLGNYIAPSSVFALGLDEHVMRLALHTWVALHEIRRRRAETGGASLSPRRTGGRGAVFLFRPLCLVRLSTCMRVCLLYS